MLTDAALKHLKPKEKLYKVTDRDGMYVLVRPSGVLTFQLDYRTSGRRETITFGKYGPAGLSLARARELCIDAKRAIIEGRSPAIEKQREKRRLLEVKSFGEFGEKWLTAAPMADSTRAMRRSIFERELIPRWRNRLLTEITPDDLRAHCGAMIVVGARRRLLPQHDSCPTLALANLRAGRLKLAIRAPDAVGITRGARRDPERENIDAPVSAASADILGPGDGAPVVMPWHAPLARAGLNGGDNLGSDAGVNVGASFGHCRASATGAASLSREPKPVTANPAQLSL